MSPDPIRSPWTLPAEAVLRDLGSSLQGLPPAEVKVRSEREGPNLLPSPPPPGLALLFLRQFKSPLIYVLLAAAVLSLAIGHGMDFLFITLVLAINAGLGTAQEYGAEKGARSLKLLMAPRCDVRRGGEVLEIPAEDLVTGDLVLLETGDRVPADLRLLSCNRFSLQESLLTGESLPVPKNAETLLLPEASLGDRVNMAFAGTLVTQGRALGLVTAKGAGTQLGLLSQDLAGAGETAPPLIQRLERFSRALTYWTLGLIAPIGLVYVLRGLPWTEVLLASVALAVSAIPEGLPMAITVALSIAVRRMGRRNVIVRRLVAVESLGSCTCIASDKTGTLSLNELTVKRLAFPGLPPLEVTGDGLDPEGSVTIPSDLEPRSAGGLIAGIAMAGSLCNEGFLGRREDGWFGRGDPIDLAFLVLGHKTGFDRSGALARYEPLRELPFESEQMYAASLYRAGGKDEVFVKGALEKVLPMCSAMAALQGRCPLDEGAVQAQGLALAREGYRVLALASGDLGPGADLSPEGLKGLTFLGLAGILDPLREDSKASVEACRAAGIRVVMVTGDHPETAFCLARQLGLASSLEKVASGVRLREAAKEGQAAFDRLVASCDVFARVEPSQKLEVVRSLARSGHFVAVTGDGANDAPALKAAHVGVAMGRSGNDVAKENADIVLTDDRFASIVAGVEEGRVAYANVRKVVLMLIAMGVGEVALFLLAVAFGLPLPLTAAQLLWLNLVTNGIQGVAMAFEAGEGDELRRPPRDPQERLFNRLMVERTLITGLWMGGVCLLVFRALLESGAGMATARNLTLLLLVLFENVQVGNSRSEARSAFRVDPRRNPLLLLGTLGAVLLHAAAMVAPWLSQELELFPLSLGQWALMGLFALTLIPLVEAHKALCARRARKATGAAP